MDAAPIPVETLLAHREWVRSVALAVVRDPNAADDVEQETWLAALSSPPRHEESLRGWFGAVARSRARRIGRGESRREARESVVARGEATQSAADLAEIADTHRRVVQAVVEMAEPYRQTILLRYFEGLAVEDVAARTGVPLDTARSRIARGLAKLRDRLARELGTREREWHLALVPLIGGTRESAAGAGIGTAAAGGAIVATKTAWALGAVVIAVGLGALVATRWPAAANESPGLAMAPAAAPVPVPAPAAIPDDDAKAKPPAPKPDEPKPEPPNPATSSETAAQKLERTKISGQWQDMPLLEILGDVSAKTDVDFFICAEALEALGPKPEERRASMEMDGVGARMFVEVLLSTQSLSMAVEDARVVVLPGDGKRDESKPLVAIARSVPGAKKTITVKGVVVDEQGAPVAHAAVVSTCGTPPVTAESGADGTFSFEAGRPFGGLHAQVPSHVASWEFAVEGKYGDTVEVRLALRGQGAAVEGVVREADGRETEGAMVSVRLADSAGGAIPPKGARAAMPSRVSTAADGRYRIESFVPGEFEVVVQTKQGLTRTAKGSAKPGETVHLDVVLPATTTWRGTLRDADGKPVAGATIQAGSRWMARTAKDGSFALAGLEPGTVKARIRMSDGGSAEKSVTVEPGAEFQLDLFVGGGPRIAGRVVGEDGKPLADCLVRLIPRAPWLPAPRDSVQTDADGAFAFDELEPGSYRIGVSYRTSFPCFVSPETTTGSSDVEVRVPNDAMKPATLRARIVDADGKPAAGASLSVRGVATGETTSTSADGIGTLRLESLPRGRYLISVGTGQGWTEVGTRDVGADVDLGTVRLDPERAVALKWDAAGDLAKATTRLSWDRVLSDGSPTRSVAALPIRGVPALRELKLTAGKYTVRVSGDSVQPLERTFDVAATGDATVALPLRVAPERRIALRFDGDAPRFARVRVLDADGLVVETKYAGSPIAVRLVPGRYRVEADVARSAIETLRGGFEVPAENAPAAFDVDLR